MIFLKIFSNFSVLEGIFEAKFQGWWLIFFSEKIERDFSIKVHSFADKGEKIRGVSLVKLKIVFYWYFSWKIEGEFNFLVNFFCHFKGNFYLKLYGYWKNGESGIRPKLTFFSYVLTTGINERLIRKFNYANVHVNIYGR